MGYTKRMFPKSTGCFTCLIGIVLLFFFLISDLAIAAGPPSTVEYIIIPGQTVIECFHRHGAKEEKTECAEVCYRGPWYHKEQVAQQETYPITPAYYGNVTGNFLEDNKGTSTIKYIPSSWLDTEGIYFRKSPKTKSYITRMDFVQEQKRGVREVTVHGAIVKLHGETFDSFILTDGEKRVWEYSNRRGTPNVFSMATASYDVLLVTVVDDGGDTRVEIWKPIGKNEHQLITRLPGQVRPDGRYTMLTFEGPALMHIWYEDGQKHKKEFTLEELGLGFIKLRPQGGKSRKDSPHK